MKKYFLILISLLSFPLYSQTPGFRPPSVPLVAHDPYFSIWSPADRLWDAETVHWTGKKQGLHSMAYIDGKPYRLMGSRPSFAGPLAQISLAVNPTQTIYTFGNNSVRITLTFTTPALPEDLGILTRPVTYVGYKAESVDGAPHAIKLYFDCSSEVCADQPDQEIIFNQPLIAGLTVLNVGTTEQPILKKRGDDLRIDWGYAYLAAPNESNPVLATGKGDAVRNFFAKSGTVPESMGVGKPMVVKDGTPVMALTWDLGQVAGTPAYRFAMLAYDDVLSIRYFSQNLRPYWRKEFADMNALLPVAAKQYQSLYQRCKQFDEDLIKDLTAAGGSKYAMVNSLVYRECLAAHKVAADEAGEPLVFAKENFSNGCIATVDVIYPAAPFFLLFSPALTKAMIQPILDYSESGLWKWDFAPHDLGTYPHATGQVYGGGEETEENQMPVEETGNMLILMDAMARADGNASYANKHWPLLEKWAKYLISKGFDPENQLCTDDFAGHLAHNINLSAKAIVALAAYADLCTMTGRTADAAQFRKQAETFAADWIRLATEGDHTRLAYDQPGTWSQKYNLVWDKLLDYKLFPSEIIQKEIDYYKKVQGRYGLPLDNRERYTKTDWITWTATLASKPEDFDALFSPVFDFVSATPQRVPVTDWYIVDNAYKVGFQARPVIGGLFIKMLDQDYLWKRWYAKGAATSGSWAPLPVTKPGKPVLEDSRTNPREWLYTTEKPYGNWQSPNYTPSGWKKGLAGFGTDETPGAKIRTLWNTSDIWMRLEFDLSAIPEGDLGLIIHHDEDADVFINGTLVASIPGYTANYKPYPLDPAAKSQLRQGKNLIAIHCSQTSGGQYIDAGLIEIKNR